MTILRLKLLTKFSKIITEFLNQCKWKASKSFDWSFCILWCLCRQLNSRATVCLNKGHACSFDSDCIILSKGVGVNSNEFGTDWTDLTSEFWIAYIRIGHNHTRCHRHDQKGKIHIFFFFVSMWMIECWWYAQFFFGFYIKNLHVSPNFHFYQAWIFI